MPESIRSFPSVLKPIPGETDYEGRLKQVVFDRGKNAEVAAQIIAQRRIAQSGDAEGLPADEVAALIQRKADQVIAAGGQI